jgi:hypothetical protein
MGDQPRDTFLCPACNRRFGWKRRNIGIKFRCACGHTRVIPDCPDPDEPTVEPQDPLPVASTLATDTKQQPPPDVPILGYESARKAQDPATDELLWLTVRDLYVPAVLVAASGVLIALWDRPVQLLYIPMTLIGSSGLALSLTICDPNPGPLVNAILKFIATVLAPFTLCVLILHAINSCYVILLAPVLCLAGHATLMAQLFELDVREAALSTSIAMLGFLVSLLVWVFVM